VASLNDSDSLRGTRIGDGMAWRAIHLPGHLLAVVVWAETAQEALERAQYIVDCLNARRDG
jgi:hypothetical protein